jgi:BTB/POZ domain-containing protein KCTD9
MSDDTSGRLARQAITTLETLAFFASYTHSGKSMVHTPRANGCRRVGIVHSRAERSAPRALGFCARGLLACLLAFAPQAVCAQGMMGHVDLSAPEFIEAEMTREQVATLLAIAKGAPADLTGKRLNGLDLSGMDFSKAVLRSARLNKANLKGSLLAGAVLDQAWMISADLSAANLTGASLFQTQLKSAKLDGADLSGARIAADLTGASLTRAVLRGADISADMRNQSMGLMRGVLRSANLEFADFTDANLARADLEYASLRGAVLARANFAGAQLGGADLTGADIGGAGFEDADVDSARLVALRGETDAMFARARNLSAAIRQ